MVHHPWAVLEPANRGLGHVRAAVERVGDAVVVAVGRREPAAVRLRGGGTRAVGASRQPRSSRKEMNHRLPRRSLTKSGASGWVCTRFVGAEDEVRR
jgi:hypothetical protein